MKEVTRDHDLNAIISAALRRADPEEMVRRALTLEDQRLTVRTGDSEKSFDLSRYRSILLLGAGKASAPMARAVEGILAERISGGVVITKSGHGEPLARARLLEASHPVPDEAGIAATDEALAIARQAGAESLVITVISGGGSALFVSPYDDGEQRVSLEDMQKTTELLLASGATIQEINCLRKHLSAVKGGRLAQALAPATSINLILSDVVGDELSSIASGITSPDPTSYSDALRIAEGYAILERLPEGVRSLLEAGAAGEVEETPVAGDPVFEAVHNVIIGSNAQALAAAAEAAESLGYATEILTSTLTGEAREMAKFFAALAQGISSGVSSRKPPVCLLAGGETTVTLTEGHGLGGRNQELALAFIAEALSAPQAFSGVRFCSLATDGNDGPTDSAGGWFDAELLHPETLSMVVDHLRRNDAYHALEKLGAHLHTGATNTNVCDIQVLLIR